MEYVDGKTVREFKKDNEEIYQKIILSAINDLIDKLSSKNFLIIDFALDNIMWNNETKTLTYIDINPRSFNRKDFDIDINKKVKNQPLY